MDGVERRASARMRRVVATGVTLTMLALFAPAGQAAVALGTPFGTGMVLQRERPAPVWGWASPGQTVTVEFAGKTQTATANQAGRWRVELPAMPAGGPYEMTVRGPEEIKLGDILVGEVWIASGQSNMAMSVKETENAEAQIAAAEFPRMRVLTVPISASGLARDRLDKAPAWQVCTPKTAGGFSAVAYFFGRELSRKLDVPVGLIVVATGATPIEAWIPREGLATVPELAPVAAEARKADDDYRAACTKHAAALKAWEAGGKAGSAPAEPAHLYAGAPGLKLGKVLEGPRHGLGAFFNGSVAPVVGYGLHGMIWYQGESNRGDKADDYFTLHKALVAGWRKVWGQGDFPFYYVQISSLQSGRPGWHIAEIWDGQNRVLGLPNTGMAVIHDLCEDIKNIHPKRKEGVGQRLALWALAKTYGVKDLPYAGPIYKSHAIEGKRIRIQFDCTFGGLKSRDGKPLDWFAVAGADGTFVPAQAEIDGETVVVSSDKVAQPVAVQFAWDGKAQPNLMNGAGLPAAPFRTQRPK
jgi:sialate O-acetylesterase